MCNGGGAMHWALAVELDGARLRPERSARKPAVASTKSTPRLTVVLIQGLGPSTALIDIPQIEIVGD